MSVWFFITQQALHLKIVDIAPLILLRRELKSKLGHKVSHMAFWATDDIRCPGASEGVKVIQIVQ